MGITVETAYKLFPQITGDEIERILGTSNFDEHTVIESSDVAQYNGKFAVPVSVWFAKNETDSFLPLLNGQKKTSIMAEAGINPANDVAQADKGQKQDRQNAPGAIPMGVSVFDIAKQNEDSA